MTVASLYSHRSVRRSKCSRRCLRMCGYLCDLHQKSNETTPYRLIYKNEVTASVVHIHPFTSCAHHSSFVTLNIKKTLSVLDARS